MAVIAWHAATEGPIGDARSEAGHEGSVAKAKAFGKRSVHLRDGLYSSSRCAGLHGRAQLADQLSRTDRRALMARIKTRGTAPEVRVLKLLRSLGYRPASNDNDLPGCPDLVLRRRSVAVFVHGCFWHRHVGCARASIPCSSRQFWLEKFEKNRSRDRRAAAALRRRGWSVVTVWECQTAVQKLEKLKRRFRVRLRRKPGSQA